MTGIRFERLFRGSLYAMLVLAAVALSIESGRDNPLAFLYPPVTLGLAIWAYSTVDRGTSRGLTRQQGGWLALLSMPLVFAEVRLGWRLIQSDLLVLALGHWLLYLVWIKMAMPKSVEDDWFLFLLGLVIVLTAAVISQSDLVGQSIFLWAIISLWALTLFHLEREAARSLHPDLPANLPASARIKTHDQPYIKIFDRAFLWSGIRVVLTTLFMSVVVFLTMPRGDAMRLSQRMGTPGKHLTGFDEEVKLGQLGEILENDAIVLTVEFFDSDGKTMQPNHELYWRGVTMATYDRGQWKRNPDSPSTLPRNFELKDAIKQKIRQEPTDSNVVFGLRPVLGARPLVRFRSRMLLNGNDGTISRNTYNGVYDYEIVSSIDAEAPQPGEIPVSDELRRILTSVPAQMREELRELGEKSIEGTSPADTEARARAIERHFLDPALYGYTLVQTRVDDSIDPVLDFIRNRKEGHCEYFASALALTLRSVGIPTRLVNGFKGGDWNSLGQVMYVREKYAHAWVEALVSSGPGEVERWITLDPTPATERQRTISTGGFFSHVRQATDFIRYIWVFYVIGFDGERQYRVIYEPIIRLFREAQAGYYIIVQAIKDLFSGTWRFSDLMKAFSGRGFLGGIVVAVLAIVLFRFGRAVVSLLLRRLLKTSSTRAAMTPGIAIYERLEALLAEVGLKRARNETPREFAERVGLGLRERFQESGLEGIPQLVVSAFYQIRFGGFQLDPDQLHAMDEKLDILESQIRQPRTA
jgi:transglutaminase-like putative cysteine protease